MWCESIELWRKELSSIIFSVDQARQQGGAWGGGLNPPSYFEKNALFKNRKKKREIKKKKERRKRSHTSRKRGTFKPKGSFPSKRTLFREKGHFSEKRGTFPRKEALFLLFKLIFTSKKSKSKNEVAEIRGVYKGGIGLGRVRCPLKLRKCPFLVKPHPLYFPCCRPCRRPILL